MGEAFITRRGRGNVVPTLGTTTSSSSASSSITITDLIDCNGFILFVNGDGDSSSYTTGAIMSIYYDGTSMIACHAKSSSTSSYITLTETSGTFDSTTGVITVTAGRFGKSWPYSYLYW